MHTLTSWLSDTSVTEGIALWLAVGATLGIYSILYKENPVYRLVEHIYIGAAAGYYSYIGWAQTLKPLWWDRITAGQWPWIFALIGGSMFYFIYSRRHVWISRIKTEWNSVSASLKPHSAKSANASGFRIIQ